MPRFPARSGKGPNREGCPQRMFLMHNRLCINNLPLIFMPFVTVPYFLSPPRHDRDRICFELRSGIV